MDQPFASNESMGIKLENSMQLPSVDETLKNQTCQKMKETIFVWVDILGFSDSLNDDSKYEELSVLLNRFSELFSSTEMQSVAKCIKISDGMILQLDSKIKSPESIKKFFKRIISSQQRFLNSGYFIRGGIAVGSKYDADEKNFISNGLSRAYKLESNDITWPIIGTDENNLERMKKLYDSYDFAQCLTPTYSKSGKKVYYLDPFLDLDAQSQQTIYKNINKKITEYENNPSVQQKYFWIQKAMEKINTDLISLRCPKCGETVHA